MSTESESIERLRSTDWTISVEAEKSGIYEDVMEAAAAAYAGRPRAEWIQYQGFDAEDEDFYEDETDQAAFDEHMKSVLVGSNLYAEANEFDKGQILRALRGDVTWLYELETATDGMVEGLRTTRRIQVDLMSRYVLSGLLGDTLLEESKDLRRAMEPLGGIAIDRAILAGGAARAGVSRGNRRNWLQASYLGVSDTYTQNETTLASNSRHGDFEARRIERPLRAVKTTLDLRRDQHFMPVAGDTERVRMYHGNEAPLVRALLLHAVLRAGMDAESLRGELLRRIEIARVPVQPAGYDTMTTQPGVLRYQLDHPEDFDERIPLMRALVDPGGGDDCLELYSTNDGVLFKNIDEDGGIVSSMEIPNAEIADYIFTAARGIGGAPSTRAVVEVIEALDPEHAV